MSRSAGISPQVLARPPDSSPYRVIFVCSGNICRSPMAEVVTRSLADATTLRDHSVLGDQLEVSSAGTGPWHEGEPMDPRTSEALIRAGYPRHPHIAHQFPTRDRDQFALIVGLDRRHLQTLQGLGADPARLCLLRSFDPAAGAAADVPDPYYGDTSTFDECLRLIEEGCRGLISTLKRHWDPDLLPVG